MASFLKGLNEYWRDTADTCKPLVTQKLKSEAVVFEYVAQKHVSKLLPANDLMPATSELTNERVYILASDMSIPFEWAEAVVKLRSIRKPQLIPQSSWLEIKAASTQLYTDDFALLKLIINNDWSLEDIYGCHPAAPMTRFDMMGLLLLLHQGDEVVGVNKQRIKILRRTGSINVFRKSLAPATGRVSLYELVYN